MIPTFFENLLKKNQIRNASTEDILVLFPLNENPYIYLEKYQCFCVGYQHGVKTCIPIQILQCEKEPMLGVHTILLQDQIVQPTSLTNFKKHYLGFTDKVSFDRSTFVLDYQNEKAIRLYNIRDRIKLPLLDGGYSTCKFMCSTTDFKWRDVKEDPHNMNNYIIQCMFNTYTLIQTSVEIPNCSKPAMCVNIFQNISNYANYINNLISQNIKEPTITGLPEDILNSEDVE